MARTLGPSCRQCRREGMKLFLKGARCETAKCPIERQGRNVPPGMHGLTRAKPRAYGIRLREKQKVKRYYGVWERQFRAVLDEAQHSVGNTGEALLGLLERRLDNLVCKAGFAPSRKAARIGIVHGHYVLNGRRVDKPSLLVGVGDRVAVCKRENVQKLIRANLEGRTGQTQNWMTVDPQKLEIMITALPTREDVRIPVEEQLIVEFSSR